MAGDISFSGLSSGLDTGSIIQQLVAVERNPITLLEAKKSDLATQRSKLQDLSSMLTSLESAASALSDFEDLAFFNAVAADEDVLSVATDGQARAGSYEVEVTAVAAQDRSYSQAFGAGAVGFAEGDTLDLTIDGATTTITLEAGNSLEDVASRINSSDAAAWATVVGDGAGGGRLLVSSDDSGAAQQITFGGTAAATLSMTNTQAASDATIVVDGLVTATSTSNVFNDVLDGVTITAGEIGTTTISVDEDSEAFKEKITAFVDAYNTVMEGMNAEFSWSGESKTRANLSGDITLRNIQSTLQYSVSSAIDGLTGEHTTLASIGITTSSEGTLEIDEATLDNALASDVDAVKDIFAENQETGTYGLAYCMVNPMSGAELSTIGSIIDNDVGSLSIRIEGIDERTAFIDEGIERMEARLVSFEERLRKQFTAMEQMISSLQSQAGFLSELGTGGGE